MIFSNLVTPAGKRVEPFQVPLNNVGKEVQYDFDDAIIFPGLTNSHDHLDFNLFPQLGNKLYEDYIHWGNDIHLNYKNQINAVLAVPKQLRVQYGLYKNLLAGITTVVNHGENLLLNDPVINVLQPACLHSVGFEKNWKLKLNNIFKRAKAYHVHIGEGVNDNAANEIDTMIRYNFLKRKLVGIHGIAMNTKQAKHFKAIVWCVASNYFMFNKTAPIDELQKDTKILFGTDSTLTASWNIWDHLRMARGTNFISDENLYNSLTSTASEIWDLPVTNDMVIVNKKTDTAGWNAFYATDPSDILLIIRNGKIALYDESFQPANNSKNKYSKINISGRIKYVAGDLSSVVKNIRKYYPAAEFPFEICE
jgi:hypothetical protein